MKEQYIKQVGKLLAVPHKQKNDILRDLEEAFASAKEHGETEEQVIERLGTPEEFAEGMSELNTVVKKRMKPKTIAAILCIAVAVAVFGALSAVFIPAIIQRGNPLPYLKAISQLGDTNAVAVVEDKNADGIVLIVADGNAADIFAYIYEKTGLPSGIEHAVYTAVGLPYTNEYDFEHKIITIEHGSEDFTLELQPYLNKYQICDIPKEMFELPQNHEMLDEPFFASRAGELRDITTKEKVRELFGEPATSEDSKEIYYDCFGRVVTFAYDENNIITFITKSDRGVVYSKQ